ncbi:MAG: ArsA family ATPase [Nocardioides sp.]|nr:ArsA family ATPase [Nocardioides sp.]
MRILLFTGKGGVGKTTAAAGTATAAAAAGERTLVLSTDAAHSLGDAFGVAVGSEPTQVAPGLHVQQVDAQRRFEASWQEVQRYLLSVLDAAGVDRITAEELTVLPGAEEVLALLEVRAHAVSGEWDVIVVDCAPTAETLRLLALPEALGWYMERIFPVERRVVKALRPVLTRAAGVPMPQDSVFDALERLHADLREVHEILTGKDASVRLVLTPETVVVAEARRSLTTLSLFGYRVDGVVANRVFPTEGSDPWRDRWVRAQTAVLEEVEQSFGDVPVWRSAYHSREPVGVEELAAFAAAAYGDDDPLAPPLGEGPMTVRRSTTGATLRMALPFAAKDDVHLARHGDELVVTVGSYRRLLALPSALGRMRVAGARVDGGSLQVRFARPEDEPEEES